LFNFQIIYSFSRHKTKEERNANIGDLSARKELRRRLGCKSFDWFLKNIVPGMLGTDPNPPASGQVGRKITSKLF